MYKTALSFLVCVLPAISGLIAQDRLHERSSEALYFETWAPGGVPHIHYFWTSDNALVMRARPIRVPEFPDEDGQAAEYDYLKITINEPGMEDQRKDELSEEQVAFVREALQNSTELGVSFSEIENGNLQLQISKDGGDFQVLIYNTTDEVTCTVMSDGRVKYITYWQVAAPPEVPINEQKSGE